MAAREDALHNVLIDEDTRRVPAGQNTSLVLAAVSLPDAQYYLCGLSVILRSITFMVTKTNVSQECQKEHFSGRDSEKRTLMKVQGRWLILLVMSEG